MTIKMETQDLHKQLERAANGLEETFCGAGSNPQPFLTEKDLHAVLEDVTQIAEIIMTYAQQLVKKEQP